MKWYDAIAPFYDLFTSAIYRRARAHLVTRLNLQGGERILVLACGTGQSFDAIVNRTGPQGKITGLDYSAAMLSRARKRIEKNQWTNIKLIQADARSMGPDLFLQHNIAPHFDAVVAGLAFSVLPGWKQVMQAAVNLLNPGGKMGILDWYRPENDLVTHTVNALANAEIGRDVAGYAATILNDFKVHKRYLGGNVWIGTGRKA